ncbi:MAG: hypothetical protein C0410_12935, partial [Anaerolinea sp.]|nr:hypothetical protein [Anaerolinea sp.]
MTKLCWYWISLVILFVGAIFLLCTRSEDWAKNLLVNRRAIEVNHVLLVQNNAELLDRVSDNLFGLFGKNPKEIRILIWWVYIQIARGELSPVIPVLDGGILASDSRGRIALVRLGEQFLFESDLPHFQIAWQQSGMWKEISQSRFNHIHELVENALQQEQWTYASELLQILESWQMSNAWLHYSKARVLWEGYGDLVGAITEMEQAVSPDSDSFWQLMYLGDLYWQAGRLIDAQQQFEHATELDPGNEGAVNALAQVIQEQGRLHDAARLLETFLEKQPGKGVAVAQLAELYWTQGQSAEAVDLLRRFLEKNPDSVPVLVALGAYYKAEGRLDEAIALLEHALQLDGSPAYLIWAHIELARIAASRGDSQAAK